MLAAKYASHKVFQLAVTEVATVISHVTVVDSMVTINEKVEANLSELVESTNLVLMAGEASWVKLQKNTLLFLS